MKRNLRFLRRYKRLLINHDPRCLDIKDIITARLRFSWNSVVIMRNKYASMRGSPLLLLPRNPSFSFLAHPRCRGFSVEKYCKFPGPLRDPLESSISCEKISPLSLIMQTYICDFIDTSRIVASYLVYRQQLCLRMMSDTFISHRILDMISSCFYRNVKTQSLLFIYYFN